MSALADTSVLVDFLRGVEAARDLLTHALDDDQAVMGSVLSRVELSIGMRQAERQSTDALVAAIQWLPVDGPIAEEADLLARRYGQSHSGIDAVDYCVAATARVNGLELWTLNVRHFPMFPALEAPW